MCEINNYIKTGRETKISHYQCSFFECVQVYVARVYKKSHCHNSFFFFITRSLRVSFVFVWCVLCIHIFIYVCMFVCMYVCMFVCLYVCMYVCICMLIKIVCNVWQPMTARTYSLAWGNVIPVKDGERVSVYISQPVPCR